MTIHTVEQSRNIITKNFKILEKLLSNPSMKVLSESKDYLQNLIKEASKILKNNKELSNLVKDNKLSYDTILEEGMKVLEKNENIQNMIDDIAEDKQVIDKQEKIRETKMEEQELLKFIEKTQKNHPNFNMKDMTQNIYSFFNTYPTKERIHFPDGTIINMTPDEPAVDENKNILPLKDGIPQGEEATRIITQNTDTGVIIASPPGVLRSYFITRYGSPKVYGNELNKYQEFSKIVGFDFSNDCYLKGLDCGGKVKPLLSMDLDNELICCDKHFNLNYHILNTNIAMISDMEQFYDDRVIKYLTYKNQINKLNFIKKIKILLNLADKGRLKNKQLDSDFKLYGIHYYGQYSASYKKKLYGWALVYYSIEGVKKKICHIYLDELTDDVKVLNALSFFAKEVILAKYANDLKSIDNFIKDKNKKNLDNIVKSMHGTYIMDMISILNNILVD